MATGCQPSLDEDELVGFSDDQRENVDGIESVENSATRGREGAFVLNVDARIMQIARQNDVSFDSVEFQNSDSGTKRSNEGGPVLREQWSPTGRLSVGRSRSGFPDCKHDHLVQLLVCKNHHTREALDITDKYSVTTTVTYDGNNDTALQMPDYQCKRIKSETKSGASRTMAGVTGFLFRFHEPNTKYKINFTLKTALPKRRGKKKVEKETSACETISEISITLETGSRSIWKSVKPREKTKARIIPPPFELGPASLSKTNMELCKRSVWVVNQLQSRRNDDIDRNKDGFVSLDEFLGDYRDPDDSEAEEPDWVKEETKKFHEEYDKNHDGKLDKDEVKLWILPETDQMMAQEEARHLIQAADDNKDGKLSEEEIVKNHETFVGSEATDYGRALPKHEEL